MAEDKDISSVSISTGTMVRAILVVLFIIVAWILRDLLLVIFTAIVVASFIDLSIPRLQKLGINRIFGIVIFYVFSLSILSGMFYLFAPLLITEIYNFSTFLASYVPNAPFLNYFQNEAFSGAKEVVGTLTGDLSISSLLSISKSFVANLSGGFIQVASVAFGGIFNFILIIILSFYFSIQEKGIENFLKIIVPLKYDDYIADLWSRSSYKIGLWVRGQMLVALVVAVLIYLLLSLLGIQYALLLAIIAGITEMIPYGIWVALIPAFAFSYVSEGMASAFMVAGSYIIMHQFEVFLFTPLIIKKVVGLSPVVIILSILIGFELASFWGAILAIPVAVIVMEFINDLEKNKTLAHAKHG